MRTTAVWDLLDSILIFLSSQIASYNDSNFDREQSHRPQSKAENLCGGLPERCQRVRGPAPLQTGQLRGGQHGLVDDVGNFPWLRDHRQVSGFDIGDL